MPYLRLLAAAVALVRSQVSSYGIYGGHSCHEGWSLSEHFCPPCQFLFHRLIITFSSLLHGLDCDSETLVLPTVGISAGMPNIVKDVFVVFPTHSRQITPRPVTSTSLSSHYSLVPSCRNRHC